MELRNSLDCKQGAIRAVRYNIDGDYILTCGSNKTVKLWNAKSFVRISFKTLCFMNFIKKDLVVAVGKIFI